MPAPSSLLGLPAQPLPFVVRPASSPADIEDLCAVRAQAYARHEYVDGVAETLLEFDDMDRAGVVLIAVDKASGEVVGTVRVNDSRRGPTPLSPDTPSQAFSGKSHVYLSRFGLANHGLAQMAGVALMKAAGLIAIDTQADWMLAAALGPLVRRYRRVGLDVLAGGTTYKPHLHAAPYFTMGAPVPELPARIRQRSEQLVPFMLEHYHPDIAIDQAVQARALELSTGGRSFLGKSSGEARVA